jgi:hypothetical protein
MLALSNETVPGRVPPTITALFGAIAPGAGEMSPVAGIPATADVLTMATQIAITKRTFKNTFSMNLHALEMLRWANFFSGTF